MVNKRAQMKIQQMSFMLIAVTIFFAIVGMLVIVIKFAGLKGEANSLQQENARLLVTKLANLPELSCGSAFLNQKTNCIDEDKLMVLSQNLDQYSDFWGKININVRVIYPTKKETLCTTNNYPNCNFFQLGDGQISGDFSNFVALCRKEKNGNIIENKCELAKVFVNYEDIK